MFFLKSIVFPIATLAGTIIGVGIFALPYIASKIGFLAMMGYFLVLGFLVILLHIFFGEVSLATPDLKRLPGFAKFYFGKTAEKIAAASFIFGSFGSILAYLIIGGEFLGGLLAPYFGGDIFLWTLIYFILGAGFVYFGIRWIEKIEFWGLVSFFAILLFLFLRSQPFLKADNLLLPFDWKYLFLPYGPILFALWGASLIPEIEEMMGKNKRLLTLVITISVLISIVFYALFTYIVLGVMGNQTTESALAGLKNILGNDVASIGFIFGIIATFTSFITVGLTLKNVFHFDLKFNKNFAWLITFFVPLILFIIGIKQFIPVVSFIGGFSLGIEGIFILLMYDKVKKGKRRIFVLPLILIFILGIIYSVTEFL